ncbi:Translation initiation factor IF-1 [Spiroplasma platyhelix PALS-1]|uniref:Translation initiation factor IF-1 n=1 Tax=Spiroplasma platyhelix PALS-1 TaxID=1276218 RepID=A0A846TWV2_9MOLU|nr:translation initiation factor IF-1 [Spiroplasma platyhelix]MBE4704300.1 Translation initiation factor IF-1 [Spiroplasma platyhelix PALS-1]NKE38672.1 translation initiation factor IF-1 [Spiroplasma platyhelix PALS-1]UJB28884.1 translation initiation factor IF-1 [Spiroplasma platyhelix PALS-1]
MAKKKPQHQKQKSTSSTGSNSFEKNKPNTILCEAQVVEVLPNTKFKVLLKDFDTVIDATPSGKIRLNHIRILKGDFVTVELSTYDLTKGRIVFRHKTNKPSNFNNEQK